MSTAGTHGRHRWDGGAPEEEPWAGDPWGVPADDDPVDLVGTADDPVDELSTTIDVALALLDEGHAWAVDGTCRRLAVLDARMVGKLRSPRASTAPPSELVLTRRLLTAVGEAWSRGWQPADLVRVGERKGDRAQGALVRAAIGSQLARYPVDTIDPRWRAQLNELGVTVTATAGSLLRTTPAGGVRGTPHSPRAGLMLLHLLLRLPPLEQLTPPPGAAPARDAGDRPDVDERVLARVRALLAKAESTPYPAEAETFTTGAQALMSRHSIDAAVLAASHGSPTRGAGAVRIGVDPPYEAPKAGLLSAVSEANGCRAVWLKEFGFCTVVGTPGDLRAVEAVYTSLLVQATAAMARARAAGSSRATAFRRSFLLAFATRMHERLVETARGQTDQAAAELGEERLLPVLARRADAVEEAFTRMFPGARAQRGPARVDRSGWASGWAAADQATLGPGLVLEE